MKAIAFRIVTLMIVAVMAGCQSEIAGPNSGFADVDQLTATSIADAVGRDFIWADGILFRTVATPATFKPGHGPVDVLYASGPNATFKDGYGAISESKPGDTDYNGGRWAVMILKDSVDPDKYDNASADWDLDPDDFELAGVYFVCPLQPLKKG